MSELRVSVVIPHYDDLDRLDLCLARLGKQTLPADDFEIVVADNASPVGAAAVATAIAGRARLVVVAEKGAGPARNAGVAASRAPLLAFVDADCVPEPGWLAAGLAALDRFDVAGGAVTVLVESPRMSGAEAFETVFAFDMRSYVERKGFAGTGNLFCSRATFDAVGPFRTGVSEDVEWSHRATGKGFRLGYAADAVVGHPARRDWAELTRKWRRTNCERYLLERGRRLGVLRWLAWTALLPVSIAVHAPRIFTHPALPDGAARLRALGTLVRLRLWRMGDALGLLLGGGMGGPH